MNTEIEIKSDWCRCIQTNNWMRVADIRVLYIAGERLFGSIGLNTDNVVAPWIVMAAGTPEHLEAELHDFMLAAEAEAED